MNRRRALLLGAGALAAAPLLYAQGAAREQDIKLPQSILLRATRVIE